MGYKHYEEIDAIMPMVAKYREELRKKSGKDDKTSSKKAEADADFANLVRGHREEKRQVNKRGLGK